MRTYPIKSLRLGAALIAVAYVLGILAPAIGFARADRASVEQW